MTRRAEGRISPEDAARTDWRARSVWCNPWLIAGVALLLRLLWAVAVPIVPVSDSTVYDAFAKSIAAGTGYAFPDGGLTVYWPVGMPALYAVAYRVFGSGGATTAALQALLGTLIVWQAWHLSCRSFGVAAAAATGWIVALWPLMIEFTTILASEMAFISLMLFALEVWTSPKLGPTAKALGWGALITAASYVRPTAWPLLLIFPVLAILLGTPVKVALRGALISVITAVLLFAPWVYRNYQLYDRFVLVAANGGVNLWMGNNEKSSGAYMEMPEIHARNEVERDRYFGKLAVDFIKSHPLDYLRLCVQRTVITYSRESIGVVWNEEGLRRRLPEKRLIVLKLVSSAYWWAVLVLAAIGAWRASRVRRLARIWPLVTVLAYLTVIPVLTVAQDRYHVPINPFLAIFASLGLLQVLRRVRGGDGVRTADDFS